MDPVTLTVGAISAAAVGAFGHRLLMERKRNQASICPVCYGPIEDGMSEAWTARLEPAEGQVVIDPDDESRGFLVLDGGRVGCVDVIPAETMLLTEDAEPFTPKNGQENAESEEIGK